MSSYSDVAFDRIVDRMADVLGYGMGVLTAGPTVVWSLVATYMAFAGGTVPLLGWELTGDVGTGMLWLFIIDPILVFVAFVLSMILTGIVGGLMGLGAMLYKRVILK